MQIVIDIPERIYYGIEKGITVNGSKASQILIDAVKNGKPLPKGHGDLKDMGNLQYVFDLTREDPIYSGKDVARAIKSMTIIVEADKEESEEV